VTKRRTVEVGWGEEPVLHAVPLTFKENAQAVRERISAPPAGRKKHAFKPNVLVPYRQRLCSARAPVAALVHPVKA
jgi:hypothetical protein